jgi:protein SCO1/2
MSDYRPQGAIFGLILVMIAASVFSQAVQKNPREFEGVDVVEHKGDTIPMDLRFVDGTGDTVTIGSYFEQDRPVILIMGYYTCPMLCNLVFNGVAETVQEMGLELGEDYRIVSVSIDPTETSLIAEAKRRNYMKDMGRAPDNRDWAFLVGAEDQSKALAEAVGFKYYWDEKQEQYAHAAVITVLTDDGMISRYLYGIQFPARDLKLALMEAGEGEIGDTFDRIMLYCYHYDPQAGGYVMFAGNVMRLGGALTLLLLGLLIGGLIWRERRKRRTESAA